MRAGRLLSTLLLLEANGQMTARELAIRLEVSIRTVLRDMEALSAAGVPVYALRGVQGGWQIDEQWRARVPGFEETELQALLMAQPGALGDGKTVAAAERAISKVIAAMPAKLRLRANSLRQRLYVDTSAWRGENEVPAMLPVVQEAVSRDLKLMFWYGSDRATNLERRTVDPLGLVAKGAAWYLVANTPRGLRTYRVSRMKDAQLVSRPVNRPARFNLAAYWKQSMEELREKREQYEAILLLEPNAAEELKLWATTSPVRHRTEENRGWIALRVQFESERHACFVALGLGPRAEVIEPKQLRALVSLDLDAATRRYNGATSV